MQFCVTIYKRLRVGYMQIITNHKTDLSRQIIKIIIFIIRPILLSNHRAPIAPGDRKIIYNVFVQ